MPTMTPQRRAQLRREYGLDRDRSLSAEQVEYYLRREEDEDEDDLPSRVAAPVLLADLMPLGRPSSGYVVLSLGGRLGTIGASQEFAPGSVAVANPLSVRSDLSPGVAIDPMHVTVAETRNRLRLALGCRTDDALLLLAGRVRAGEPWYAVPEVAVLDHVLALGTQYVSAARLTGVRFSRRPSSVFRAAGLLSLSD